MTQNQTPQAYDLIGDIHGADKTLLGLLNKLGYQQQDGIYRHPTRKIIFLGDFVDRCAGQRAVIDIVRPMIESQSALSVMGNHEYNAIAYHQKFPGTDTPLRDHTDRNKDQHGAFLADYQDQPEDYKNVIAWFKTLPLWLKLDGLNVVHACWDSNEIDTIRKLYGDGKQLSDELLIRSSKKDSPEYHAIERLLKGKEIALPEGVCYQDGEGHTRYDMRVKWWDESATTLQQAFIGTKKALKQIPDDPSNGDHLVDYPHDAPPLFIGHYWMDQQEIKPLRDNIACLDYSVANQKDTGMRRLVAYRWDGEQTLSNDKFVWIDRDPDDRNIKTSKPDSL